ncbi:hypothetical protein [Mesorhizobium sp. M1406]|uniref:DUF3102 domain-containing protein n=1 Tax=Mesorhizobium sp. M1406 TaxID=2957099 RepID=UPI003339CEEC
MVVDPRVKALCQEFDVRIVGKSAYPLPGETRAVATIRRIIDRHGVEHARLILAEGRGNNALIDETSLGAISDLLRACPDLVEQHTAALLDMFDLIPLGPMMALANELRGIVHQGHALAGMIYMLARQRQGGAPRVDQRIRASEAAKGRSTGARLCKDRKLAIGHQLLEAKASLPRGHFGPWLDRQEGLSRSMASQCMALAIETRQDARGASAA